MRRLLENVVIIAGLGSSSCWAQSLFDQLNFRNAELSGFGFYGISAFAGYTQYGKNAEVQIPSSTNYGASFSAGWHHHRTNTNYSILYSGTYSGLVHYPSFNGYSESLGLNLSRKVNRRMSASLSASGQDYLLTESLFQPSLLGVGSLLGSSFNDFAASFGVGQYSTSQIQSMYQSSYLDSAIRSGLLGGRVLSYGGQASLSYTLSRSVGLVFGGSAGGGERLSGANGIAAQPNYAMPLSYGANAGIHFSHAYSPRTQVGVELNDTYTTNPYQQASISTLTGSFGRKMGSNWFLRVYGGESYTYYLGQSFGGNTKSTQAVGGGSIGLKLQTQTYTATYDRSAGGNYNYGVGTNTSLMGSWTWQRRGSRLTLFISGGQQQQRSTGFLSVSGWQGGSGFSERLNSQMSLSGQYSYLDTSAHYPGVQYKLAASSVRLSLGWTPHQVLR